jgi:UPF0716 protein FxsA
MLIMRPLRLLALLVSAADLTLLVVMLHYTSWLLLMGFVVASAVVGGLVLRGSVPRFVAEFERGNATSDALIDATVSTMARLVAGALFIVPGILSDILALLLLFPAGRRLVFFLFGVRLKEMLTYHMGSDASRAPGDKSAKGEIIDVRFKDAADGQSEKGD